MPATYNHTYIHPIPLLSLLSAGSGAGTWRWGWEGEDFPPSLPSYFLFLAILRFCFVLPHLMEKGSLVVDIWQVLPCHYISSPDPYPLSLSLFILLLMGQDILLLLTFLFVVIFVVHVYMCLAVLNTCMTTMSLSLFSS